MWICEGKNQEFVTISINNRLRKTWNSIEPNIINIVKTLYLV